MIRSSYAAVSSQYRGLDFALENGHSYMAWCYDSDTGDDITTFKVVYTAKAFSSYQADTFNVHCDSDFHNYLLKRAWIDPDSGGANGGITGRFKTYQVLGLSSDGSVTSWSSNPSYLDFKNGMLVGMYRHDW